MPCRRSSGVRFCNRPRRYETPAARRRLPWAYCRGIRRATSYVQALPDRHALEQNPQVQDAVVRNIEIIGEAVNHIHRAAPEFITQHPELPWQQMRDMRNIVIHAYFAVDLEIV